MTLFDKQKLKEDPKEELKNQLEDAFEHIGDSGCIFGSLRKM